MPKVVRKLTTDDNVGNKMISYYLDIGTLTFHIEHFSGYDLSILDKLDDLSNLSTLPGGVLSQFRLQVDYMHTNDLTLENESIHQLSQHHKQEKITHPANDVSAVNENTLSVEDEALNQMIILQHERYYWHKYFRGLQYFSTIIH